MRSKKVLGIATLIIGVLLILASIYVKNEVIQGRGQISSAQSKLNLGKEVLSLNPYTKEVGKQAGAMGQKKIEEGTAEADKYEKIADGLMIAGIIVLILGAGVFFVSCCRRKK